MPDTAQFEVGEQVLCFDGSLVYEAKIEKLQQKAAQFWYFIHYKNWKRSWDEWVPEENLFKYSEENLVYQRNILQKHEASLAKKHLSRYYLAKASEKLKVENVEEKLPPSEDGGKIPKKPKALATSSPTSTSSVLSSSPVATTQGNQRPRKRAPSSPRKPSASSSVSTAGRASSLIPLSPRKASVSVSPVISTAKATAGAKKKVSSPGKSKTSPSSSTSPVIKPCFVNLSQQKEGTPRRPHISVFEVNMDLSMEKTLQGMAVAFQKDKNRGGSLTAESPPILARTNSAPVSKFSSSPPLSAASRAASFLVEPSLSFAAIPDQAKSSVSDVVNAGQASDYTRGSPARETSEDRAKRETTPTPRSDVSLSSNASFEMAGKLRRGASAAKNLSDGKSRAKPGLSPRSETPDSPNSSVSAASSKALPDLSPSVVSQVFKPEDMPTTIPTETAGRRVSVKKSPKKKLPKSQGKKSTKKMLIAAKSRFGSSPKGCLKQSLFTIHPNEICEQRGNSAPPFVQTAAPPVVEASADPVVETSTPVTSDVDQSAENDEESKRTDDDDVHLLDRVDKEKPAAPPRVRFESDKETDTDSASVYLPRTAKKRKVAFKPFVVESIKLPSNRRGQVRRDDSDSGDDDSDIECLFALTDPIADLAPTLLKAEMSGEKALKEKKKRGRKKNFGSSEGDATEDEAPRNHFLEEDEDAAPYVCPLGLKFPVKLREVLYDDWYKIRVEMMLQMGAPAYTVEDILKEFELYACADFPVKSRKWKDTKQAVQLFKEIFDGVFAKKFLFTFEKPYHGQKFKRDPTLAASRHYGGCALVRFLSRIGKVMCFSLTRVPNKREALAKLLQDLITFVSDRTDRYCTFQEYYIAPPAYMRMYLPPGEDGETRFYGGGITR